MKRANDRFVIGEPSFPGKKPLYRLHLLHQRKDEPVYLVEGEKCVEALEKLGILATTSGGADTLEAVDFEPLAGREINLWRDNDEAGNVGQIPQHAHLKRWDADCSM